MSQRVQYKTKQMAELLSYLKSAQGSHVTVNDICSYFKSKGISVGTTTVYRHLERMVGRGEVAKYTVGGTGSACFEYIGEREDGTQLSDYHCKCSQCGKLFHLKCDEIAILRQHMLEHHSFEMDLLRTVFYGKCGECRKTGG